MKLRPKRKKPIDTFLPNHKTFLPGSQDDDKNKKVFVLIDVPPKLVPKWKSQTLRYKDLMKTKANSCVILFESSLSQRTIAGNLLNASTKIPKKDAVDAANDAEGCGWLYWEPE